MQAVTVGFEPTAPLRVQLLSREPLSATQSRYQKNSIYAVRGDRGIRTHSPRREQIYSLPRLSNFVVSPYVFSSYHKCKKSAPGRTRTADTSLRRAVLYPSELQKQVMRIPVQSCHTFQRIREPDDPDPSGTFPDCLSSCDARVHRFTRRCQLGHRTYVAPLRTQHNRR